MKYHHLTRKSKLLLVVLALCWILPSLLFAQKRRDLENKRKALTKEIQVTTKLLKTTTKNKKATLDTYIALKSQVKNREELLKTIAEQVEMTDESITRTDNVVEALTHDIAQLQLDYGMMARQAFRMKRSDNILHFIFSAASFNQMIKRWRYLRHYDQYRKKQARLIVLTQQSLQSKIESLEEKKETKLKLIEKEKFQKILLEEELVTKKNLLEEPKKNEVKLKSELAEQKNSRNQLNNAIEDIIRSEVAERRKKSRSAKPTKEVVVKNPSNKQLSSLSTDFRQNKGKLPWPVESGIITKKFGKQEHPALKKVIIDNNGIDIQTENAQEVRAIFAGKVKGTQFIPGFDYTVIIQHGDYYTVYSNLREISVKRGDEVSIKQQIGIVRTNPKTNKSEVHFEVWKEKERLNPVYWVRKS